MCIKILMNACIVWTSNIHQQVLHNNLNKYLLHSIKNLHLSSPYKWKVIFYGTDEFSVVTLKALNLNRLSGIESTVKELDVLCINTNCAVKRYASISNLNIHYWPYIVPEGMYDVGIVVSFGHLIQTKSILACKFGMINAHPSLLPRWRGASPLIHTILHDDKVTGVTVIEVAPKKFDIGRILAQQKYTILPREDLNSLQKVLADTAAKMIVDTLKVLPDAFEKSYPQPTTGVKNAPKFKPDVGKIDWVNDSLFLIDRKFRAFKGFIKVFTYWKDSKVVLINFLSPEETNEAKIDTLIKEEVRPGFCYFHKKRKILYIRCKDGWIGVTDLSVSSRKKATATEFYNGYVAHVKPPERYFRNNFVNN